MKLSELNYQNLDDQDKYNLIMYDISNNNNSKTDGIIVLGCSPIPLYDRILKLQDLYIGNISNNIFLSGGTGWHKYWQQDESKKYEIAKSISDILGEDYNSFSNYLKNLLVEKRIHLTEVELMILFMAKTDMFKNANIYSENKSSNTKENALYSKELIDAVLQDYYSFTVITTAWHARRSYATFKKYFKEEEINIVPSTNDLIRKNISLDDDSYYNYYYDTISSECHKLISYSNNNWIEDLDISSFLSDDIVYNIEKHQKDGLVRIKKK